MGHAALRTIDEQLLERLVALNAERAAEEARGLVRWLRPEFQNPVGAAPTQAGLDAGDGGLGDQAALRTAGSDGAPGMLPAKKQPWPKELPDQVRVVAAAVTAAPRTADEVAAAFTGGTKRPARVAQILAMLADLGRVRETAGGRFAAN